MAEGMAVRIKARVLFTLTICFAGYLVMIGLNGKIHSDIVEIEVVDRTAVKQVFLPPAYVLDNVFILSVCPSVCLCRL